MPKPIRYYEITSWLGTNDGWLRFKEFRHTQQQANRVVQVMRKRGHESIRINPILIRRMSKNEAKEWLYGRNKSNMVRRRKHGKSDTQPESLTFLKLGEEPIYQM